MFHILGHCASELLSLCPNLTAETSCRQLWPLFQAALTAVISHSFDSYYKLLTALTAETSCWKFEDFDVGVCSSSKKLAQLQPRAAPDYFMGRSSLLKAVAIRAHRDWPLRPKIENRDSHTWIFIGNWILMWVCFLHFFLFEHFFCCKNAILFFALFTREKGPK